MPARDHYREEAEREAAIKAATISCHTIDVRVEPVCRVCGRVLTDNEHAIFGGSPTFHGFEEVRDAVPG